MRINAEFSQLAREHTADMPWVASPMQGVSRRMLDRIGDEVARATSIVRYDAGSKFSPHVHSGGEEFLVLSGVFQDEHGDYPQGTYVRNPINTGHTPASLEGCEIFVKLWQFHPHESEILRTNTLSLPLHPGSQTGVNSAQLYKDEYETVSIESFDPDSSINLQHPGGMELLVLAGSFHCNGEDFTEHSWLRLPMNYATKLTTSAQGARVWLKTGHLREVKEPG